MQLHHSTQSFTIHAAYNIHYFFSAHYFSSNESAAITGKLEWHQSLLIWQLDIEAVFMHCFHAQLHHSVSNAVFMQLPGLLQRWSRGSLQLPKGLNVVWNS